MHSRHKSRAADAKSRARQQSEAPVPAESATRIKRAHPPTENLHDSVQASLDAALDELEHLELTEGEAARTPPAPPQRMPKGMPPLPFRAALPSKMPPLPRAAVPQPSTPPKKRPR